MTKLRFPLFVVTAALVLAAFVAAAPAQAGEKMTVLLDCRIL